MSENAPTTTDVEPALREVRADLRGLQSRLDNLSYRFMVDTDVERASEKIGDAIDYLCDVIGDEE